MVSTLNEMANKLQSFIIDIQSDAHNSTAANLNVAKYNNLKLSMDETIRYPHISIRIGISGATFSLKDGVRMEGGLGSDEKYVRKWLGHNTVSQELTEIYDDFIENLNYSGKMMTDESDDYALEQGTDGKVKSVYEARAAVGRNKKNISYERELEIKEEIKEYLDSSSRKLI